ncbi:MAG TPA: TIGR04282 family arsenosugar biosynthesis glycosyltransferase [Burkholderiales bacterium]
MNVPVLVFSRAPVIGKVKTRLAARLGEWRAARLHIRLTRRALRTARDARVGPVELHVTSDHSAFRGQIFLQLGKDLGERMYRALRRHRRAILIGSDCPALEPRDLRRAARLLCAGYRVVLAPTEDGGYALVAARAAPRAMFEGVDWGTSQVMAQTARRLEGLRWARLRMLVDVDRPEDLDQIAPLFLRRSATRSAMTP